MLPRQHGFLTASNNIKEQNFCKYLNPHNLSANQYDPTKASKSHQTLRTNKRTSVF